MSTEPGVQTCPRRIGEPGPWEREHGLDRWRRDRWCATRDEADREIADFMARHPNGYMGDPKWPGKGPQPRTCSFCGGIHPEDAIELVEGGWQVEVAKSYKRYLRHPEGKTFIPPVKLYTMHFTHDHAERFNRALSGGGT